MTPQEILDQQEYFVRVETDSSHMDNPCIRAMRAYAKQEVEKKEEEIERLQILLDAAERALELNFADMVREKLLPLGWEGPDAGEYFIKTHLGYYVIADINYNGKGRCKKFLMSAPGCRIIEYNTLDEAKAAAQDHYTSKVLELFKIPGK